MYVQNLKSAFQYALAIQQNVGNVMAYLLSNVQSISFPLLVSRLVRAGL